MTFLVRKIADAPAFLPAVRAGRGRLVMVSSSSGRVAVPYSASKFAVEALSDALRRELRPWGVPVVVVEPADRVTTGGTAERHYGPAMDACLEFGREEQTRAMDASLVRSIGLPRRPPD